MVTLYSQPGCQPCRMTALWLDKHGVEYTYIDISTDQEGYDFVKSQGYQSTPVVKAGDIIWSGLRPDMLQTLVA